MNTDYQKMKRLFLQQSYLDTWEYYEDSMEDENACLWDYVILTASNELQAEAFRKEIECRLIKHSIPDRTNYAVISDPDGKRIGSGGATLNVLRYLYEKEGMEFVQKKVMVIHSGGDSKRVPQYSVCGKLFSPVPRELPDGRVSTLFDEFLIAMAGVPGRMGAGLLTLSGDVMLLFNVLQMDMQFEGAAAISIKEPVSTGKDHGVFLNDGNGYVKSFLHKQSIESLTKIGAVNNQGNVDLDTGAVMFDGNLLLSLWELVCTDGQFDEHKFNYFVNEKSRISFYGDFLYPLAEDSTLEEYFEQAPEGEYNEELKTCRTLIWEKLSVYRMKLICLAPAEFIHFGTTWQLWDLETKELSSYEHLGWSAKVCTDYESDETYGAKKDDREEKDRRKNIALINVHIGDNTIFEGDAYLENCVILDNVTIGDGAMLSGMKIENASVPGNCCMHSVKLMDGRYVVRIYDKVDNPKGQYEKASFLGTTLTKFMLYAGLTEDKVWPDMDECERYLWNACLFPSFETQREAFDFACIMVRAASAIIMEDASYKAVICTKYESFEDELESLYSSYAKADAIDAINVKFEITEHVKAYRFINEIGRRGNYEKALWVYRGGRISQAEFSFLMDALKESDYSVKMRAYLALSRYMKNNSIRYSYDGIEISAHNMENRCFDTLSETLQENTVFSRLAGMKIACDEVKVELPVRVNWGGGWTDTPPYCNENGGIVLNAAILINGKRPVQVVVKRLDALRVEFESEDIGVKGQTDNIDDIRNCNNPYDFFALHKAALIASGVIPADGDITLREVLKKMGGGIYISTKVTGIPKGSGLGTSSILAGAAIKALAQFMGCKLEESELYDTVLVMEQLMSTGGGWQDQVGGLTDGIKYITTRPGIRQDIKVEHIELSDEMKKRFDQRFAIIYTGQRRLARNLLREVVGNYINGRKETVDAIERMKVVAEGMRGALINDDFEEFAKLLNRHWELSKQLDPGVTNTCIDQIFATCDELIDARFIAGAGGGGFLQVILKEGVTRQMLDEHLENVFQGTGVAVWDSRLV